MYKDVGWLGWGHWLGNGNVKGGNGKRFLPFDKAVVLARGLNLASQVPALRMCCLADVLPC